LGSICSIKKPIWKPQTNILVGAHAGRTLFKQIGAPIDSGEAQAITAKFDMQSDALPKPKALSPHCGAYGIRPSRIRRGACG
jgi:hypothetical protein